MFFPNNSASVSLVCRKFFMQFVNSQLNYLFMESSFIYAVLPWKPCMFNDLCMEDSGTRMFAKSKHDIAAGSDACEPLAAD